MNECKRFCPSLRVLKVHRLDSDGNFELRQRLNDQSSFDVAITTYEMLKMGDLQHALLRCYWRAAILDEGHRIKNDEALVSKACLKIK